MLTTPQTLDPATVAAQVLGTVPAVSDQAAPPPAASHGDASVAAEPRSVTPTPDGMIDAAGRVFDAKRFKAKPDGTPFFVRNKINGKLYFQPIGGRRKIAAPAVPADPVPAPAVVAAPEPLPIQAAPAWSDVERAAAAQPAADADPVGLESRNPAAAVPAGPDHSADAGKAITHGVCLLAGVVLDAREETKPSKAEAEHLTEATAAWIRSTGWRGGPLAGALLAWFAYFLGLAEKPKISAKLAKWMAWFGGEKPTKRAEPIPVTATPVPPTPAAAPAPSAPASPLRAFGESAG